MQGAGLSSFAPLALAWEDTADSLRLSQFSSGCQNARAGLKTGHYRAFFSRQTVETSVAGLRRRCGEENP